MTSILKWFLTTGRVFAIRIRKKRPCETEGSSYRPSPPTGDDSPESRLLSEVGDVIELVSPIVQAVAGAIPVAGTPLKAAVDGLLYIIQMVDTTKRNKATLDILASRVLRLLEFLSVEPQPRDEVEARRRKALTQRLQDISSKLMKMQGRRGFRLAYNSMTQDIAECNTDIVQFLSEYAVYDLAFIKRQLRQLLASPRDCAILIDAAGHEHKVHREYCTSFQQLSDMLPVLIPPERSGASVQRRYITSGKFEFCIDDGRRVTLLTSDSNIWQNIEAGTRIVMRVIFERQAFFFSTYECHLCGAWNTLVSSSSSSGWLTDGSLDCHACKGRFQISISRDRKTQGGNDHIDTETRHSIRNFRVTQTPPVIPPIPPFSQKDYFQQFLELQREESHRMATTSCDDPNHGIAVSHSQSEASNFFARSPLHFVDSNLVVSPYIGNSSHGGLLESGPIAQRLATSSQPFRMI